MLNINLKCSEVYYKCPEGLNICCQFCKLNYSPCEAKCSGCWDKDQVTSAATLDSVSLIDSISTEIETELTVPVA